MYWWENESILPFRSPTTCMVSGATMSGKTHFIYRVLLNATGMFEIPPQKIIYCYSQYQLLFDDMEQKIPDLILYQGLQSKDQIEEWTEVIQHSVLILDDLMTQVAKSEETGNLQHHGAPQELHCIFLNTESIRTVEEFSKFVTQLPLRHFISIVERLEANIIIRSLSIPRAIIIL